MYLTLIAPCCCCCYCRFIHLAPCLAVPSFMKLRLDRVLKVDLSSLSEAEVMSAGDELPDFKKPEKWTAPYSMYTPGWWKLFYPGAN